ncbi:hypothetical protein [Paraglaciecola sp. 2405UD69-4]|uniref:hypothetical protein n=1 Tax=Paraglaciecola sp. 2405UD69-4 TaxID=3391836 RepID=UPI0039C8F9AB
MKLVYKILLTSLVFLLVLNEVSAAQDENYTLIEEYDLPAELKESSALFCSSNDTAFTLNDSGNQAVIYEIDNKGIIVSSRSLDIKNKDWEAITGDENYLYIGDIGNNRGNRKKLKIQKVTRTGEAQVIETVEFSYSNNITNDNKYLAHDFDAEAMVNHGSNLYLFSKSWDTGTLFIYKLDKTTDEQVIKPAFEVNGLPGVITGGDYDTKRKQFVLVGYKVWGLGFFSPFMTILDENLNLVKYFNLEGYGQVEGVCITSNDEVWFTQENSFFSKNKLVKVKVTY